MIKTVYGLHMNSLNGSKTPQISSHCNEHEIIGLSCILMKSNRFSRPEASVLALFMSEAFHVRFVTLTPSTPDHSFKWFHYHEKQPFLSFFLSFIPFFSRYLPLLPSSLPGLSSLSFFSPFIPASPSLFHGVLPASVNTTERPTPEGVRLPSALLLCSRPPADTAEEKTASCTQTKYEISLRKTVTTTFMSEIWRESGSKQDTPYMLIKSII